LAGARRGGDWQLAKDGLLQVHWPLGNDTDLAMVANLTEAPARGAGWRLSGQRIFSLPQLFPAEGAQLAPWSVCFALGTRSAP
jgi:hypothetical protein